MPTPLLAIVQAGAEIAEALDVIVLAQVTMAIVLAVILLLILGAAIAGLVVARRISRKVRALEGRLEPKLEPLLESATRVAGDVSEVTGRLKGDVEGVRLTVSEANLKLRDLISATEERVRRLGQVLDVVQEETEHTLLDVASTARGVQAAARRLREAEGEAGGPIPVRERVELRIEPADATESDEL